MSENTEQKEQVLINYMAKDYNSFRKTMLDLIPEKFPEWNDLSESDFGVVLIEMFSHMADILSYYQDRVVNESFLSTARERKSIIEHLRLIGYEMKPAKAAKAELIIKVDKNKTGIINIEKGAQFATKATKTDPSVVFEYMGPEPLSIDTDAMQPDPENSKNKVLDKDAYIPVVEGQSITNEILAISDGTKNQKYRISQPDVLPESIEVFIDDGSTSEPWEMEKYFFYSSILDKHYTSRIDEDDQVTIYFGDGRQGKIPQKGSTIRINYRVGGGSKGNVGKNQITEILDAPDLSKNAANIYNPESATGGKERETEQEAIRNAPSVFRSQQRAVSKDDIEALALNNSNFGILKVKAKQANWNNIKLFIVPDGLGELSDTLKLGLKNYFEEYRMLSTIIHFESPIYVKISISAEITLSPYYYAEEVKNNILQAIQTGVLGIDKVDFGKTVYLSKIYEEVEKIEGVLAVNISKFLPDVKEAMFPDYPGYDMDKAISPHGKIDLDELEFPIYNSEYIQLKVMHSK